MKKLTADEVERKFEAGEDLSYRSTGDRLFALAQQHRIRVGRDLATGAWYLIHPDTQVKHYAGTQAECYEQLLVVVEGLT